MIETMSVTAVLPGKGTTYGLADEDGPMIWYDWADAAQDTLKHEPCSTGNCCAPFILDVTANLDSTCAEGIEGEGSDAIYCFGHQPLPT